jgi:hypothetical protein
MPDHFNYISFGDAAYVAGADGPIEMYLGRMFEYTPTELEKRLEGLEARSRAFLETLPTFLCSEAYRTDDGLAMVVRFGRVTDIQLGGREVRATFHPLVEFGEVRFEHLEAAQAVFEADSFELYRTHWAVREGDAEAVLARLRVRKPDLADAVGVAAEPVPVGAQAEPPPREKHILGEATSVETFLQVLNLAPVQQGHETFFRGHHDVSFELTPFLLRKSPNGDWRFLPNEDRLCKELLIAHYDEFQGDQYSFDRLVRMQHYGLPTRLLDITTNPLMALFFACADPAGYADVDGEVILFSMPLVKVRYFDSDTVSCLSNLSQLTYEQKNGIDLLLDLPKFNGSPSIQKLLHHIKSEKGYFEGRIVPQDMGSILCVKAKQTNSRIRSQSGAFLLFGHEATLPDSGSDDIAVARITIREKEDILRQLDKLNVNAMTAYPSIDRTAEHLKAQYP